MLLSSPVGQTSLRISALNWSMMIREPSLLIARLRGVEKRASLPFPLALPLPPPASDETDSVAVSSLKIRLLEETSPKKTLPMRSDAAKIEERRSRSGRLHSSSIDTYTHHSLKPLSLALYGATASNTLLIPDAIETAQMMPFTASAAKIFCSSTSSAMLLISPMLYVMIVDTL